MTCEQVQKLLAQLTWPQGQASRYTALRQHVQHCGNCQQLWEQWRQDEAQLTMLLSVETAPKGLWETIMTSIQTDATTVTHEDLWRSIVLEVSPQGIQRLVLQEADRAGGALQSAGTQAAALLDQARTQLGEYFRGERAIFQLPVSLDVCTPFER